MPSPKSLTDKQKLFVLAYAGEARFNAARAARLAGYAGKPTNLAVAGARLLKHPGVRAAIDARLREKSVTADIILGELSDIALGGIADLIAFDADGKPSLDWEAFRQAGRVGALKHASPRPDGTWDVAWHDRVKALELLGKAINLFDPAPQGTGDGSDHPLVQSLRAIAANGARPPENPMIAAFQELLNNPDDPANGGRGPTIQDQQRERHAREIDEANGG